MKDWISDMVCSSLGIVVNAQAVSAATAWHAHGTHGCLLMRDKTLNMNCHLKKIVQSIACTKTREK